MTIRPRYLTWKLRALCWDLRQMRDGGMAGWRAKISHSALIIFFPSAMLTRNQ